jgi:hypothetical protein
MWSIWKKNREKFFVETQETRLQESLYPIVALTFNGTKELFKIRDISNNTAAILSCGDISLIETFENKIARNHTKNFTIQEMNEYAERQHKIAQVCMIEPSYQKVLDIAQTGINIKEVDAELKEIKRLVKDMPKGLERTEFYNRYNKIELLYKLVLPADFLSELLGFTLKIGQTDIKTVTKNMLITSAILATNNHNAPHENLSGVFTEFNKYDIDRTAWNLYAEQKEENRKKRKAG